MRLMTEIWVRISKLSEVPRGEGRIIHVGDRVIALFHPDSGVLRAIDNACPHRGGPLAHGILAGESVICPLHGWKIDLKTGEAMGDHGSVMTYPVMIEQEWILLGLPSKSPACLPQGLSF
ncbi:MAG: nitrite reductase small subunit NirD [Nitrospirae bacterium]|nr:nitrite reductase small subunit NirD [Nitrospirota bacterium]